MRFLKTIQLAVIGILFLCFSPAPHKYELVETYKIWDSDEYAAFTTLVKYKGWYVCAFREAKSHSINVSDPETFGKIRLIRSKNAKDWELVHTIKVDSADLRDPKLSVSPKGELVLIFGRREVKGGKAGSMVTDVVKFKGKKIRKKLHRQIEIEDYNTPGTWLWNLTWNGDTAYGFVYGSEFFLVKTKDAIHYEVVCKQEPCGFRGTEADLYFLSRTSAIAIARGSQREGIIGESKYPFIEWQWERLSINIGGPDIFRTNDGDILIGSRNHGDDRGQTSIYKLVDNHVNKVMTLPSTNDSSYPSFLQKGDNLLVTYYSGDKANSDIYISNIKINTGR